MTVSMPVHALTAGLTVPIDLGRDEARDLARAELADPSYDRDRPLIQRVFDWLIERLFDALGQASGAMSSSIGVAILVGAILTLAVVIIIRGGPLARRARGRHGPVFSDQRRTAAEHRRTADQAGLDGDWSLAVVERFRAIVAGIEERSYIEPRPGRTADEFADEAGAALPDAATDLTRAARLFDAVYYGDHRAGEGDDEFLRRVDAATAAMQPVPAAEPDPIAVHP